MAQATTSEKIGPVPSISSPTAKAAEVGLELSIVIPVFNERDNLRPLYERLKEALKPWDANSELLFIADCITAVSTQALRQLAPSDPRIRTRPPPPFDTGLL